MNLSEVGILGLQSYEHKLMNYFCVCLDKGGHLRVRVLV